MTFKDLRAQLSKLQQSPENSKAFDILCDKPFWIWDQALHVQEDINKNGNCCFNHIVGLPVKDKTEYPMFDYEQILYDALLNPDSNNPLKQDFKDKHLWVKKATGLLSISLLFYGAFSHILAVRTHQHTTLELNDDNTEGR